MADSTHMQDRIMESRLPAITTDAPVFLFSGQGSQKPGMGADLIDIEEVASTLACASDVFGYDITHMMLNADPKELNETRHAQAALCALSIGIAHALTAYGVTPVAVLGFSLGQISALAVSGMLSDEETFALLKVRSDAMADAAAAHPGVMSALLKIDEDSAYKLCEHYAKDEVVVPANFNCPGQIVISGEEAAVERIEQAWTDEGGRVARLATSGAFHSPLMADASQQLADYLESVSFREPTVPLICNVDAAPLTAAAARDHLAQHLVSPVLFDRSVQNLIESGAHTFAEVGFGGVLFGLIKRINKDVVRLNVQDRDGFDTLVAKYGSQ